MHVIVIGAGVVGLSTAYFLLKSGARVTLVDSEYEVGRGASFANGALLHPSLIEPWNEPGIGRFLLRTMWRRDSPIVLRARHAASLAHWGPQFMRNSQETLFKQNALRNLALALRSAEAINGLVKDTGIEFGLYQRGTLMLFRAQERFESAVSHFNDLLGGRVPFSPLDATEIIAREPSLTPIVDQLAGAIHFTMDRGADARRFCEELATCLCNRGVRLILGRRIVQLQFEHRSRSIIGLIDSLGDQHEADAYVLAAGAQTPILGKRAHVRIPIVPVKGYSISIISDGSNLSPLIPVTDAALHIAVTPLDHGRLRIAGTAELAGYDRSVRPERVKMLRRVFGQMYPHLICDWSAAIAWAGLRPVTPDGVPIISRTLYGNLFLNCGHGHLGWTLCAASGELMAAIVMGEGAHLTQEHYALTRF